MKVDRKKGVCVCVRNLYWLIIICIYSRFISLELETQTHFTIMTLLALTVTLSDVKINLTHVRARRVGAFTKRYLTLI